MTSGDPKQFIFYPPTPDIGKDHNNLYRFLTELWRRTGGYKKSPGTDLTDLNVSAGQLNMLGGIRTDNTVQQQIDTKTNNYDLGDMAYQNSSDVLINGGVINGVDINGISLEADVVLETGSSLLATLGGTLFCDLNSVGNTGSVEEVLMSKTILGGTLSGNSSYLEVLAFGTCKKTNNNQNIRLKISSYTLTDIIALTNGGGTWVTKAAITKSSATNVKCSSIAKGSPSLFPSFVTFKNIDLDLSVDFDIFCTATATDAEDIVQKGLIIKYYR